MSVSYLGRCLNRGKFSLAFASVFVDKKVGLCSAEEDEDSVCGVKNALKSRACGCLKEVG